jgi:hypothetical protein
MAFTLKTHEPTGRIPWPLILIEGGEKCGKSWSCAELSASKKVGQTYWIDLGEGSADEYGAIPDARYLIVEHDGSFGQVIAAVEAVKSEAEKVAAAKQPPVVLVIDSFTAEWELLKGIADAKARDRLAKKGRKVAPDAEPQISMDLWNEANARHRKLMTTLMTFPGIVLMTARGKEVASLDANGRPIEGSKEYKVEGQKNLAYDASCWVRLDREHPGIVVGSRSVHAGVRPGRDKPQELPADWTLEWLIFEALKCNPHDAQVRDLAALQTTEPESPRFVALTLAIESAPDLAALKIQWEQIQPALLGGEITDDEAKQAGAAVTARKAALEGGPRTTGGDPAVVVGA